MHAVGVKVGEVLNGDLPPADCLLSTTPFHVHVLRYEANALGNAGAIQ